LRLLPGDRGQVAHRAVDQLRVAGGLADPHVHHDLHQTGDLHDVLVAELLAQGRADLGLVPRLQPRLRLLGCGRGHAQMSLPERREMRTLPPSSSLREPTRVGLPSPSSTITLLTWIAAPSVTIPPVFAPPAL